MNKHDNPPAFPPAIAVSPSGDVYPGFDGMGLRDYFAGQFADIAWMQVSVHWSHICPESARMTARAAYDLADAFLAERERQQ